MIWYIIFVILQLIIRGKNRRYYDLLQIPLSILFTRFMNLFNEVITIHFEHFWQNMLLLILAVILTGIGAAMSVDMKLVPTPGDGILSGHFLVGIGIGTVVAVIGVGRSVFAFNYLCKEKMAILTGLNGEN